MKIKSVKSFAILFLLFSCEKPSSYIVPTNIEALVAQARIDGITQAESDSLSFKIVSLLQLNTKGKTLPNVPVKDMANNEINLQEEIVGNTIILAVDIHCAFGFECAQEEYPKALKRVNKPDRFGPTICLLIKTSYDHENAGRFNEALPKLKPYYSKVFVIEEQDARKVNLISGSTRLYLNKEKVIVDMVLGHCTADKLVKEIMQNAI